MKRAIPREYRNYLENRSQSILAGEDEQSLTFKGIWIGCFLSFFLAIGAPYGNMIIRGSYMALDFSTPGAIFLFLGLTGLLNALLKLASGKGKALALAVVVGGVWLYVYWPLDRLDPYSPGVIFSTFFLLTALVNLPVVWAGRSMALNRSELILVYAMLLIVSALCTMGLSEQILPMITAIFYFASPQNKWADKLLPHFPEGKILVDDGGGNRLFYEGMSMADRHIPYDAWIEPLLWWGVFLLALYVTMVSVAVILRRQWVERERLPYPITQVGLAMVREEEKGRLINAFFRRPAMWIGAAFPLFFGSLTALHRYDPAYPVAPLTWYLPFLGTQRLRLSVSFAMVGFSYLINANIAAGIWFFHILSKCEKWAFILAGYKSEQKVVYGVSDYPFLAYQGVGALLAMVLVSLWVGREHFKNVFLKAIGRAPDVDDRDEILSYRSATVGALGGTGVMVVWLWIMGTPFWVAALFILVALLIFIGVTRIVAEAGLAAVRTPMIAPDLVVQGLGSSLIGPSGVVNLSLSYMWAADIRVFVMATCANALKLIEEMEPRTRRMVFGAIILALFIGALGSFWMIFHMAYRHGGINLNGWFFKGAPATAYDNAVRNLEAGGIYWPGWGFFLGGGGFMVLMMWARQRFPWWPFHPIGFPIGANWLMEQVWFSVFLAWGLKRLVLRFGGAGLYRRSQAFFLGLIAGQVMCNGIWLIVDYFTGKVGNGIFSI